jgi:hypothetical protein
MSLLYQMFYPFATVGLRLSEIVRQRDAYLVRGECLHRKVRQSAECDVDEVDGVLLEQP